MTEKKGFTHDSVANKTVEWYTPKWIFDRLGIQFDLDPCQPVGGIDWIPANKYYTIEDDGLKQDWSGNVWLNPLRYGIVCINDEGDLCKRNNAQNVVKHCQQQLNFSQEEKIDQSEYRQDAKNVLQFEIGKDTGLNISLLNQEKSFIEMLNSVLKYVAHAMKRNLCRLITLDCAMRYELGFTQSVVSAVIKEREKLRLNVEQTLLKDRGFLKKNNDIINLIKDEKESVFNLLHLITLDDSEILILNGTGVPNNGLSAKKNGITNVLIAEKNLQISHKTTTFQFLTKTVSEQLLKTSCQPVCRATAQNKINILLSGYQKNQSKKSIDTLCQFSIDYQPNVWLNPPYGKHTSDWLAKMHNHRNGIALVFARTDCKWFHDYCAKADAILFIKSRVKFIDGLGVTSKSGAGSGSMLIAWGSDNVEALKKMRDKGFLVVN